MGINESMIITIITVSDVSLVSWSLYIFVAAVEFIYLPFRLIRVSLSLFLSLSVYWGSWRTSMYVGSVITQHKGIALYYCCLPGTM